MEYTPIENLVLNEKNPRTVKKDDFEKLVQSLEKNPRLFDDRPIIASNRTGENIILCGNTRYKAALELGWKEVPASIRTLTEEEEREWIIRDNVSNGEWDWDMLANEWDQEELEEWGVDLPEIEAIEEEVEEDDCDTTPPKEPITKRGDIYELGQHRVMCGDSTMIDDVEKLMDGEKADMVFTDPPYNIASDSENFAHDVSKAMDDLKNSDWDKDFNIESFINTLPMVIKENCTIYVWTSHFLFSRIIESMKEFTDFTSYMVWAKPNPMPSLSKRHPTWNTELCVYGSLGSKRVVNFPSGEHFLSCREVKKKSDGSHPTQKPIELCAPIIRFSSSNGFIVYDGFLGSGSTLIACEQTNRKCYGMELDEKYCDVVVRRYIKYCKDNGKEPIVKLNGKVIDNIDQYD